MISVGADANPGPLGAVAPWYRRETVGGWARKNAKQAAAMWQGDQKWRSWLTSRSGDPATAKWVAQQSDPSLPTKSETRVVASRCGFFVRGGQVVACCRVNLPGGEGVMLTASAPIGPLYKALEQHLGRNGRPQPPTAVKKKAATKAAATLAAAKVTKKAKAMLTPARPSRPAPAPAARMRGGGPLALPPAALLREVKKVSDRAKAGDPKAKKVVARLSVARQLASQASAGNPKAKAAIVQAARRAQAGDPKARQVATAVALATRVNAAAKQVRAAQAKMPPAATRFWQGKVGDKARLAVDVGFEPVKTDLAPTGDENFMSRLYRAGVRAAVGEEAVTSVGGRREGSRGGGCGAWRRTLHRPSSRANFRAHAPSCTHLTRPEIDAYLAEADRRQAESGARY